jgi:peptidoglycan/LPS O-acetylase OafA/YrhL
MLRFFAFFAVFLHHALPGFVPGHHSWPIACALRLANITQEIGGFGVCLFFLLSAYLITSLLQRELDRTGTVHVGFFYIRRGLRIWPLYFAFVCVCSVAGLFLSAYHVEPGRIMALLFVSGNWYAAAYGLGAYPIAPLWSLSVEEQFYLAWPWIARLGGRRVIVRVAYLLFPLSWLSIYWFSRGPHANAWKIWVNSLVQFQFFAAGALLAIRLKGRVPNLPLLCRSALGLAGVFAWCAATSIFHLSTYGTLTPSYLAIPGYTFVAVGCAALFFAFLGTPQRWISKPLVYMGKISYGLYVLHRAVIDYAWAFFVPKGSNVLDFSRHPGQAVVRLLAVQVGALLATILLAVLSYQFFERRFLKWKERFTFIPSRGI